jgi:hypothetical protein
MPNIKKLSLEWFIAKYGPVNGPVNRDQWRANQSAGKMKKRKSFAERIAYSKIFKQELGNEYNFSQLHLDEIDVFFKEFPKYDRNLHDVMPRIVEYIRHDRTNWIEIEHALKKLAPGTLPWFTLIHGEMEGYNLYYSRKQSILKNLPSRMEYWADRGCSPEEAIAKIQESQRKNSGSAIAQSCRTTDFWISRGHNIDDSKILVASRQRRDLEFYMSTYCSLNGIIKYYDRQVKKKAGWSQEKRYKHGEMTAPKAFNPHGQEMQAISGFIEANHINPDYCMFGAPEKQFYQYIPGVGYRRYDLAVFTDELKNNLKYIFEFHGPAHINFSEYNDSMKNERVLINGSIVKWCTETYGEVYHNDLTKRNHILNNYPNVEYVVMWVTDLKHKRFNINELSRSTK